jgi:hypothetical protein
MSARTWRIRYSSHHYHNARPARSIAVESSVHRVSFDTTRGNADDLDDFVFPEAELELEGRKLAVVPEPELLLATVIWPDISFKNKEVVDQPPLPKRHA